MKIDFNAIQKAIDNDKNQALLEDNFPQEALELLDVQEGHDKAGEDNEGRPTTKYGIIDSTIDQLSKNLTLGTIDLPEYIVGKGDAEEKKEYQNALTKILLDKNSYEGKNKEQVLALAKMVSQYYQLGKSFVLDGYTDGKFSQMGANVRYATLINYNKDGLYKAQDSLLVYAIKRNNPALVAKSFYSSGKKDKNGNWILKENGDREMFPWPTKVEERFLHFFNAKMVFADHIPTKEEYIEHEKEVKKNGRGPVLDEHWNRVDKTLDDFANKIEYDKSFWIPELYKNKDIKKGRQLGVTINKRVVPSKDKPDIKVFGNLEKPIEFQSYDPYNPPVLPEQEEVLKKEIDDVGFFNNIVNSIKKRFTNTETSAVNSGEEINANRKQNNIIQ